MSSHRRRNRRRNSGAARKLLDCHVLSIVPVVVSVLVLSVNASAEEADGKPEASLSSPLSATQVDEAGLLVEQGRRLQAEGNATDALELYRAAILLDPSHAEAHRWLADLLYDSGDCSEAAASYRAFVQLATLRSRRGPSWDEALLRMASCVRSEQATLVLLTSLDARCAVDKGVFQDVLAAQPLSIDVVPGEHLVECVRDGHPREARTVTLTPKESLRVEVAFAVSTAAVSTATASEPASGPEPEPVSVAQPASADDLLLLPLPDAPTDDFDGFQDFEDSETEDIAETRDVGEPPSTALVDEIPTATLRIATAGTGWSCSAAGQEVLFDGATVARLEVSAGPVTVSCSHPESESVEQIVSFAAGELRSVEVPFVPRAVQAAEEGMESAEATGELVATDAIDASAALSDGEGAEQWERPSSSPLGNPGFEFSINVGMGSALGSYGLGLGARYRHVGLMVGSGWQPFAVALNYFGVPGGTGFYASAGYQSVGPAPLFGAARASGFELFGSAGLDARPLRHVGVRLGVGFAYNSVDTSLTGPMRLDFAVSFIP